MTKVRSKQQLSKEIDEIKKKCCCAGGSFEDITYVEALSLVSTSALKPGTLYRITGVHKNKVDVTIPILYDDGTDSGTTIYLTALTTSEFSTEGWGEFYNPRYDQENYGTLDLQVGQQLNPTTGGTGYADALNVPVTGGTGTGMTLDVFVSGDAVGYVLVNTVGSGYLNGDVLTIDDGNNDATITISVSPYLYNIWDGDNPATYGGFSAPDRKIIWGGYVWEHGTFDDITWGTSNSVVELNDESWTKIPYNTTDYNFVIDYIEYDWANDWISRRRSSEHDIDITFTYDYWNSAENGFAVVLHGIAVIQWGNHYDVITGLGTDLIVANNAYIDNINFKGLVMLGVTANHYSVKMGDYYGINTEFRNITLNGKASQINNVFDTGGKQTNIILENGGTQNEIQILNSSYQEGVKILSGTQSTPFILDSGSSQTDVTLMTGAVQNGTYTNGSYEFGNTYMNGGRSDMTLDNSVIQYCTVDHHVLTFTLTGCTKTHLLFKNDLSTIVTDIGSIEKYSIYGNTHNEFNFEIIFANVAGEGQVGALTIPIMLLSEIGTYIEEVIISCTALTAGAGAYITLGILTDDVDSGLDSVTGLAATLSNATLKYTALPYTRSTATDRYLVMSVGANAITGGRAVLYVKTRRRTFQ